MQSVDLRALASMHPILSCEGTAEEVAISKLHVAGALIFPTSHIVAITRLRKAEQIQEEFLTFDYEWPVVIVRVHDSLNERFCLGKLYRDRFPVQDVITHPEMEALAIIREGQWERWQKTHKRASDFCRDDLRMTAIKTRAFLEEYWTVDSLVNAAFEYRRITQTPKNALALADIIGRHPCKRQAGL